MKHISQTMNSLLKSLLEITFQRLNFPARVVCFSDNYNSAVLEYNGKQFYVEDIGAFIEKIQQKENLVLKEVIKL